MNKRTTIASNIFCLLAGMLLTIFSNRVNVLDWVVILLGIMFVIPSLISVITLCIPPKDKTAPRQWFMIVPATAGLILGILMICKPEVFTHLLTWLFAIMLIIFGIFQIAVELVAERDYGSSRGFLVVPIIITVTGIVIICMGPERIQHLAALITGLALIVYSFNGIMSSIYLNKIRVKAEQHDAPEKKLEQKKEEQPKEDKEKKDK